MAYCSECGWQKSQHPDDADIKEDRHLHFTPEEGIPYCSEHLENPNCSECHPKNCEDVGKKHSWTANMEDSVYTCFNCDSTKPRELKSNESPRRIIPTLGGSYYFEDAVVRRLDGEFVCRECGIDLRTMMSTLAMMENSDSCMNGHKVGISQYTEKRAREFFEVIEEYE